MTSRRREHLEQELREAFRQDLSEAEGELAQAQLRVATAQAKVEAVKANYEKMIEAFMSLNRQLSHHSNSAGAFNGDEESQQDSSQKVQARDFVEPIVLEMNGVITQTAVRNILIEKYPTTGARIEGSTISKVLRNLEKEGVIRETQPAIGNNPAQYEKVNS
jgi:ribosomal protein S25